VKWLLIAFVALVLLGVGLRSWRFVDDLALNNVRDTLVSHINSNPATFDRQLVAALPEPARRFFESTIEPGTPLYNTAEISMHGEFSLGKKQAPAYQPMKACQLLAPPYGFYWQVRSGSGLMTFLGSDAAFPGGSWTRFWLAGLLPVARMDDSSDHALSSFGRYMAEAIFWTPAALLPSANVQWEALDNDTARVTIKHGMLTQAFDLTIDNDGHLQQVQFQRWSNANETKTYQRQSFGGHLSDFQQFEGYWLPTTVEAGNHFGTDAYFPFFKASIERIEFLKYPKQLRSCPTP